MSNNVAIRVNNLGKKYSLGKQQEPYLTFRDAIIESIKAPLRKFHNAPADEGFWALKDVSFEVEPGEIVGIIGRNGAGKSTLLKILSRIATPTEGSAEIYGRLGSLLEVGTGFHQELTGRENIYLSGSILGMKKQEIDQKFDEIVKFSEIEKFLDTPVKRYSSGMYVRLAFAVAAHLQTEILLVDEVLAVGDVAFQKKCMSKMSDVAKGGRTVFFVSHNMDAIKYLCNKCILLNEGVIQTYGEPNGVIDFYLESMKLQNFENKSQLVFHYDPDKTAQITSIVFLDKDSNKSSIFNVLDPFKIILEYEILQNFDQLFLQFELRSLSGTPVLMGMESDWANFHNKNMIDHFPKKLGKFRAVINFPAPLLNTGIYEFEFYLTTGPIRLDTKKEVMIEIKDSGSYVSYVRKENRGGVVCPPIKLDIEERI